MIWMKWKFGKFLVEFRTKTMYVVWLADVGDLEFRDEQKCAVDAAVSLERTKLLQILFFTREFQSFTIETHFHSLPDPIWMQSLQNCRFKLRKYVSVENFIRKISMTLLPPSHFFYSLLKFFTLLSPLRQLFFFLCFIRFHTLSPRSRVFRLFHMMRRWELFLYFIVQFRPAHEILNVFQYIFFLFSQFCQFCVLQKLKLAQHWRLD